MYDISEDENEYNIEDGDRSTMLKAAMIFRYYVTDRSMIPQTSMRICEYNIGDGNEYDTEDATEDNNKHISMISQTKMRSIVINGVLYFKSMPRRETRR